MSDSQPSADAPKDPQAPAPAGRILPIRPEAWPKLRGMGRARASLPPPLPRPRPPRPPQPDSAPPLPRPGPVITSLAYLMGGLPMAWAILSARGQAAAPGDDFATLTVPATLFMGVLGALVLGMPLALVAHSDGEPKALRAVWLIPLLAVVAAFCGMVFAFVF